LIYLLFIVRTEMDSLNTIELEIQKEELVQANVEADVATHKYIELYDFAPSGYFTLSKEGKIIMLNIKGASMLGKERQRLINNSFGLFVSHNTRPIFNNFLIKAFEGKNEEACEVAISVDDNKQPLYVILTGHVHENSEQCQIIMVDITKRKQVEEALTKKMDEMHRFHNLTVDREFAMIELKKEVNELLKKDGLDEKYIIVG